MVWSKLELCCAATGALPPSLLTDTTRSNPQQRGKATELGFLISGRAEVYSLKPLAIRAYPIGELRLWP